MIYWGFGKRLNIIFPMNTNFENEVVEDLKRRKDIFRRYTRSLSPTEKIRQLELLQRRHYNLLKSREENGGRKIPKKWQRWHESQI